MIEKAQCEIHLEVSISHSDGSQKDFSKTSSFVLKVLELTSAESMKWIHSIFPYAWYVAYLARCTYYFEKKKKNFFVE